MGSSWGATTCPKGRPGPDRGPASIMERTLASMRGWAGWGWLAATSNQGRTRSVWGPARSAWGPLVSIQASLGAMGRCATCTQGPPGSPQGPLSPHDDSSCALGT